MSEREPDTFARFAQRFRAIEAEIGAPPPPPWHKGSTPAPRRSRSMFPATVVVAVVAVIAAAALLSPLLAGRDGPSQGAGGSVAGGVALTPSPPPSSPISTATSLVPLDPLTPPEELPGPCLSHTTVFDRARTTIEQDAAWSSAIVVGTILEIGDAQWNTVDGRAPQDPDIEPSRVMRLLRVRVEDVVKGTAPAVATISAPGGSIGCQHFNMGGFADAQVGRRYVFFLSEKPPRKAIAGVVAAWQTWAIEGGDVATSFEGNVPLEAFVQRASAAR